MVKTLESILEAWAPTRRAAVEARADELIQEHKVIVELQDERRPLVERLEVLAKALWDGKLDGMSKDDLALLRMQRDVMIDYVDILDERIARLKEQG